MKLFKIFLFTILFIVSLFILFNVVGYLRWEKEFLESKESIVCLGGVEIEQEDIDEKIEKFILSNNRTEFIVFEIDEVLHIVNQDEKLNETLRIKDMCIGAERGVWSVYIQYQNARFRFPWLKLTIVKDQRETPELYVNEILIGGRNIPFGVDNGIRTNINRGISEGIILLNENQFLGRDITNIELLEDRTVIKGDR